MSSSYYDILQINRNATKEEIKNAYHKLAKIYHPDNKNSQSKDNQNVYLILNDRIDLK